jgi:beta-lactamase regulating signal transducer with metallopeptidase domain
MLLILLKSSACLAIFMLFYKFCLEKTSVHTFKRFYLLVAILISISIPFITYTEYVEVQKFNLSTSSEVNIIQNSDIALTTSYQDYIPNFLWSIYALGVMVFSFRFFKNLHQLFQRIKSNPKFKNQNYINVLLHDLIHPHTFFNYIFLNKTKYEHNQIPHEVILHEQTHAKQKHALDILFIEVLQIVFWFNPLLYFIKKDIKLNHEFLADQAVINTGFNTKTYQQLLLAYSSNATDNPLANAINFSLIKKRFTVMKTKTSKTALWLRSLILLPLLVITLYSFSEKIIIEKEIKSSIVIQQKATPEQIAEYNKLAKKYNAQPENQRIIKLKDINRLEYLYNLMSKTQKANAESFPNCPPPPPPPPVQIVDTNKASGEFLKIKAEFDKKGNEYGKSVNRYLKEKKGNITELGNLYTEVIQLYKKYTVLAEKENLLVPPPPPPAPPMVKKSEISDIPPPPPPEPKAPLDHVIEMAKKGATFYYNDEKISSDKAIDLMKNNKDLNISSKTINGKSIVKIQTEPIRF